jgi:hypothetical protein
MDRIGVTNVDREAVSPGFIGLDRDNALTFQLSVLRALKEIVRRLASASRDKLQSVGDLLVPATRSLKVTHAFLKTTFGLCFVDARQRQFRGRATLSVRPLHLTDPWRNKKGDNYGLPPKTSQADRDGGFSNRHVSAGGMLE